MARSAPTVPRLPTATTRAGQLRQVYEGRARETKGGLRKRDLKVSSSTGKIVSRRASRASKVKYRKNGLAQFQFS